MILYEKYLNIDAYKLYLNKKNFCWNVNDYQTIELVCLRETRLCHKKIQSVPVSYTTALTNLSSTSSRSSHRNASREFGNGCLPMAARIMKLQLTVLSNPSGDMLVSSLDSTSSISHWNVWLVSKTFEFLGELQFILKSMHFEVVKLQIRNNLYNYQIVI